MASLTTTPSRLVRSPTSYPFAVFFFAAALGALAAFVDVFAALAGLPAFAFSADRAGTGATAAGAAAGAATARGTPPRSRWIVEARRRAPPAWPIRGGVLATALRPSQ